MVDLMPCAVLYSHVGGVFATLGLSQPPRRGSFRSTMKARKPTKNGVVGSFNTQDFLDTAGVARKIQEYRRGESIYSQGDAAESVMYIQKGGVEMFVVNWSWYAAILAKA